MATIHPSRIGLVPQEGHDSFHRSHFRSSSRTPERKRSKSQSDSPGRERGRSRRHSPDYNGYSKESKTAPWHDQGNMYPERRVGRGKRDNYYQTGSSDWFTHRQQIRDNKQVSIWPPSPKGPERSLSRSPSRKRHKKRSRDDRSVTPSSSETVSSEEGRKRRKETKARRRHRGEEQRESKRRRHERRERPRSRSADDRKRRSRIETQSPSPEFSGEDEEWVEKPVANTLTSFMASSTVAPVNTKDGAARELDDDSDVEFGPQPSFKTSSKVDERAYGSSLLRGEGSAMAAFLTEDTNARIPRRGEIGLASDQIAAFEAAGYVMSGSRHRRMNAVRLRKENQVISAEEKRGILRLQKEERARREELLREEFKELMNDKLKVAGTKQPL